MDSPNDDKKYNVIEIDEEEETLPGFRFHPTDEELVGFYLRRKVQKKPLSIDLIKPIDIYKFDPWDLPKASCTSGDKEGYFFCKRGRKYKNSIRPNRVTGSGFWKATGIDKPVHGIINNSTINNKNINNNNNSCIGLKKTLVYYRGSAGKGTKTDWMMHEFRLPNTPSNNASDKIDILREAEMWTLCRIFKRNVTHRKYTSDWRELSSKHSQLPNMKNITSYSNDSKKSDHYIDFSSPLMTCHGEKKVAIHNHTNNTKYGYNNNDESMGRVYGSTCMISEMNCPLIMSPSSPSSLLMGDNENDWDELRAVVEYALHSTPHV